MKMEFFERGRHFVDESLSTIVGLVVGAVISSVNIIGLGTKPVMAIVQKSSTGAGTT
jgi:K(+)-stimulated pyrophosphate-energized sodium pump